MTVLKSLLQRVGLRRTQVFEPPTLLDELFESPLQAIIVRLYLILTWIRGNPVFPPRNRQSIKVVVLSDTHDQIVPNVPDGDLLIHAGDLTNAGTVADIQKQIDWLHSLPHAHKVLVCGNHDSWFDIKSRKEEDTLGHKRVDLKKIHYLEHKSITLAFHGGRKLNVYGAPDIPKCGGDDFAFQYSEPQDPWTNSIPMDTDVLVTHTPPKYHLDLGLGCPHLQKEVWRVKPKLHVFGHVHWGRGKQPIFWDECQGAYERLMQRPKAGFVWDVLPSYGWVDAVKFLYHGVMAVLWQYLMMGPKGATGSIMINAGMMKGNTGKLLTKVQTIEI